MASPLFVHDYTSASAEARTSPRVFNVAYQSVNRHKWPAIEVRRRYGASCTLFGVRLARSFRTRYALTDRLDVFAVVGWRRQSEVRRRKREHRLRDTSRRCVTLRFPMSGCHDGASLAIALDTSRTRVTGRLLTGVKFNPFVLGGLDAVMPL